MTHRRLLSTVAALMAAALITSSATASTPGGDVRLTDDDGAGAGYTSNYTLVTGAPYTDATLTECSRSLGRQNEPTVAMNPRNPNVIVGSSNDYCGVYNDGVDNDGAPLPTGPVWLGYYRSENGGASFTSSLVPGYPGDTSPFAGRARIRTASAGDPVLAWDAEGRLFAGAESSGDPALTKKTLGDVWVATFENPAGSTGASSNDGKEFVRSVVVGRGSSAPNLLGVFQDKTAIEADRTTSACRGNVYFANSRFKGNHGGSNIYVYRSTDHGATFSNGTLLTTSFNDVQDPDIAVTSNGHVYVTFFAITHKGNVQAQAVMYAKSIDCGATFAPAKVLETIDQYTAQDIAAPEAAPESPPDDSAEEEAQAAAGIAADCGDFAAHCDSGYTFFRHGTSPRSTADQYAPALDESLYVVYSASIPGTQTSTGTTFGTIASGTGSQAGAYFVRLNGATGQATAPMLIDPTDASTSKGHQIWPDVSADGGIVHVLWWDSRNDACYSPSRPIGNCADLTVGPALDVYATVSSDRGATYAPSTRVSDQTDSPDREQFDGRTVPFAGDYLWITSFGSASYGAWTDQRDAVAGSDQREADDDDGDTGADVLQCRTELADGSFTGDTCPRDGGLDQNIYGDATP
jgi:hypothetical protein